MIFILQKFIKFNNKLVYRKQGIIGGVMQYMIEWLRTNRNEILKKYPEADPELSFSWTILLHLLEGIHLLASLKMLYEVRVLASKKRQVIYL